MRQRSLRWVCTAALVGASTLVAAVSSSVGADDGPRALFIANNARLGRDDAILAAAIEQRGFDVVVSSDNRRPAAADAEEFDLVWISATVQPGLIGAVYADARVPIGTSEPGLYRPLGLAAAGGTRTGQRRLAVADGVEETTNRVTSFSWARGLGADATVDARLNRQRDRAAIFRYDRHDALANGTSAADCRAGFFAGNLAPRHMNATGVQLFDDLVGWLMQCGDATLPPLTIADVADSTITEGESVDLEVAVDGAIPGAEPQFSAVGLPPGLRLDPASGRLAGSATANAADNSPYLVRVTVTDRFDRSDSTDFVVTVVDDPTLPPVPDRAPNVVVIMTDDQTVEQMRRLPAVADFMSDGVEFANSLTNYPLCGPSRATFLTGQHAINHDLECNSGLAAKFLRRQGDSLAPWLHDEGIHTIHVGKYLNGYGGKPATRYVPEGWDDWRALAGASAYHYTRFDMVINGEYRRYGQSGSSAYSTDVLSDHLDDAIRSAPADSPFFAVFTPLAPHVQGGKSFAVPAPRHAGTVSDVLRTPNFDSCRYRDECATAGSQFRQPKMSRAQIAIADLSYQTASESLLAVDEAFERLVATLTELGQIDNTVIMFTSDNGYFHGQHGLTLTKLWPGREALFVPLYVKGPGFDSARVVEAPVSNIDLAPTIIDIFDAQPTVTMDGQSLLDPIRDDRVIFIQGTAKPNSFASYHGVFADGWLFYDWQGLKRNELYGPDDPWQLETLDNDPEWDAVEAELLALTQEMADCAGAACDRGWTAPAEP